MTKRRPTQLWVGMAIFTCMQLCTGVAAGQGVTQRFEVFVEGGGSTFTDHSEATVVFVGNPPQTFALLTTTSLKTTGRFISGVRLWLNGKEALEASYSYSPSDITQTQRCVTLSGSPCNGISGTGTAHTHFLSFNYVRAFHASGRLRPFLTVGLGFVHFEETPFSHTSFAANIGGGADFRFSAHWALRAEYRDFLFDEPTFSPSGPTGLTHNQVPSLGLVFRF